ncbi:hypothetical protein ACFKO7_004932, partial [Escherichia coli]
LDIRIPYATDPAGNRLPDPELHPDSTLSMWPDNRIARDAHYLYRYDCGVVINSGLGPSSLDEPASLEWCGM